MLNQIDYEHDFYAWAMSNAALIRDGRFAEIDALRIAEELESMGKSEQQQLINRMIVLLAHLLKWQFQPQHRSSSWNGTINEQRKRIRKILKENPSLKYGIGEKIAEAYDVAISRAFKDTGIPESEFPQTCPYSWEQISDDSFYPEILAIC